MAILPVVGYHAFPGWVPGGFIGVDVFFVISGYLIAAIIFKSLENGDFYFREFYAHRIRRIFPALILVLAACFAFGWFALLADEYKQLGKHIAAGAGFVQNFVLWKEVGYFDVASELKPLLHLWSLSIEEQFYLIFPFLLWLIWRRGLNTLTIVVLLFLWSAGQNAHWIHHDQIKAFYAPQTRIWQLMVGALLAYAVFHKRQIAPTKIAVAGWRSSRFGQRLTNWRDKTRNWLQSEFSPSTIVSNTASTDSAHTVVAPANTEQYRYPHWLMALFDFILFNRLWFRNPPTNRHEREVVLNDFLSLLGFTLIIAAIFVFDKTTSYPGNRAAIPVLGALMLITAGRQALINRYILSNRLAVWIGLISYPLYLWHWPLLSFARIVESGDPGRWWRLGIVAISFVLAALTYWLVEKPLRYGKAYRGAKAIALAILALAVGIAGYYLNYQDGLKSRKSVNALAQQANMFDGKTQPWKHETKEEWCKKRYPFFEKQGYCRLAKDAEPTIQLVGDSHSAAAVTGVFEYFQARAENALLITTGGILPFFNVLSANSKASESDRKKLLEIVNTMMQEAENNHIIRVVVMWSRGPLYLSSRGYFEKKSLTDEANHDRILQLTTQPELMDRFQIWEIAMRDTLQRLIAKGKRIIFVLDNPELGFDPKSCVDARPLRLTDKVRTPCGVTRKAFDERNKAYRELVLRVLKDFPQVKIFDAAAHLCDDKFCWAMKDGKMLYFDDDHLSLDGSRYIAQFLGPMIREALVETSADSR